MKAKSVAPLEAAPKSVASTRNTQTSAAAPAKNAAASAKKSSTKTAASTRAAKNPRAAKREISTAKNFTVAKSKAVTKPKSAPPTAASTRAKKWKARLDIAWTQSADALAQRQPQGRTALAKSAKCVCEYSLRRAIFQKEELQERAENSAAIAVDITFVSDEEIAELNADYRGKPRPTDVLSFAQSESADDAKTFFAPPDAPLLLGDLIVSLETALRQSRALNHDLESEIAFLVAHGTLHLMGYDHAKSGARKTMFALQDAIVEELRVLA